MATPVSRDREFRIPASDDPDPGQSVEKIGVIGPTTWFRLRIRTLMSLMTGKRRFL